jgi:hypothetical protein
MPFCLVFKWYRVEITARISDNRGKWPAFLCKHTIRYNIHKHNMRNRIIPSYYILHH